MDPITAVLAGGSIIGGLFGSSQANRNQREANRLNRRALEMNERNYADRGVFRDFSTNALRDSGLPPELWDAGPYNPDEAFTRYQPLGAMGLGRGQALADVMESPDRMALIKQRIADLDSAGEKDLERRFRRVGQRAATLGRVGSAGVTTELGTLQASYESDRQRQINELLRETTEADLNDRFRRLDAVGREDDTRYGRSVDDFARRDALGRNALEERVRRWNAGRGAQGEDFARALSAASLGFGNDPSGMLLALGQNAQGRANAAGQSAAAAYGTGAQLLFDRYRPAPTGTAQTPPQVRIPQGYGRDI